jgi:glycosyltransferase involved in cell wall biosynthesis
MPPNISTGTTTGPKIRVLQLIDQLGDAGAEQLLYTFAAGLDRSRFDLHVCALRPWPHPKIVPALRELGFPVTELDQHHAYDLPVLRALVNYIRLEKIDIIHTHLLASDVMGRLAGFITRCPVVSTIHNGRIDLDKDPRHQQFMERWSARLWCRRLIVVSTLLRDEVAAWFGLPRSKVLAIPNGIDTARFRPPPGFDPSTIKRELLGGDYRMVANVARLVPQKGQHYLIEAAARLASTHPDVRFVLVGHGPLGDELMEQARTEGIADKVVITGPRSDVPQILAASDVFVLSSLWEGMPLSLLEAMAAGCPAIATDVGGVREVLRHDVTGLLVPRADSDALAAAIAQSLDHPERARQRASSAQALTLREYDKSTMIRKWEAVYLRELRQ